MRKKEIEAVAAETLALGSILAMVLRRLSRVSPEIAASIRSGFDDAANFVENSAMRTKPTMPQYVAEALRIVEQLRSSSIPQVQ